MPTENVERAFKGSAEYNYCDHIEKRVDSSPSSTSRNFLKNSSKNSKLIQPLIPDS